MDDHNPYEPSQTDLSESDYVAEGDPSIRREGKYLIAPLGAHFPTRCVSCNVPTQRILKVEVIKKSRKHLSARTVLLSLLGGFVFFILLFSAIDNIPDWCFFAWPIGCVLTVVMIQRWRSVTSHFYICSLHSTIRILTSSLSWLPILVIWGMQPRFLESIGFPEESIPRLFDLPYMITFCLCIFLLAYIPHWTRVQIAGERLADDQIKFQGFGEKYLEGFANCDDT